MILRFLKFWCVAAAVGLIALAPRMASAQVTPAAGFTPPDDTPNIKVGVTIYADYTYTDAPQSKDADGNVVGIELSDIDPAASAAFQPHVEEPSGLLAEEDIEDLGADLPPDSSAAILLFEHLWATKFRDAVLDSGGELLASIRIPKEVVDEVVGAS